ncbi:putative immunity protein [Desulfovibrio sp.]|uniref:putative immunity protein n=1 Tax=Desulfovibrio sp. TaxID=885 RepID=UPI0025BC52F2|nr:hypothetical protein [Desulfovibrio sp.]
MFFTTLNRIRSTKPCQSGWKKLLRHLGKIMADDEPLSLSVILESNGIDDAIWSLQAIDACPEIQLFAVRCVRQIQHTLDDIRSLNALDVAERYAVGAATVDELEAAQAAARNAARATEDAAEDALLAAWAAWAATEDTAEDAVWAAVWAARATAGDTPRKAQYFDFIDIFCS